LGEEAFLDVAESLSEHLDSHCPPESPQTFRAGDVRHCFADTSRIQPLGYQPHVCLEEGVAELVEWVRSQTAIDGFERARKELMSRGLAA
jgi:dTDP-L-rhamnose 4-epimerase